VLLSFGAFPCLAEAVFCQPNSPSDLESEVAQRSGILPASFCCESCPTLEVGSLKHSGFASAKRAFPVLKPKIPTSWTALGCAGSPRIPRLGFRVCARQSSTCAISTYVVSRLAASSRNICEIFSKFQEI
jgi:hypothetical protein